MKGTFKVGAEFDFMTAGEASKVIADAHQSWVEEVSRGVEFRRVAGKAKIAGASLAMGGSLDPDNNFGPGSGMVWDIRRIRITGYTAGDKLGIYLGEVANLSLIAQLGDVAGGLFQFARGELVLKSGEELVIGGNALTTPDATDIFVTIGLREMPAGLAWRI